MPVVDDQTCLRIVRACQQILERAGCQVTTAESFGDHNRIELVVTLPGIDESNIHDARLMQLQSEQTT